MRTRFIHDKFILDVSQFELNWTEENTWFKDEFFMNSSFPFEIDYSENEFFNQYRHLNLSLTEVYFQGKLEKDGRVEDAVLEVEEASNRIRLTIRYGVEALPNWTKKLNELSLDVVLPEGGSMITHANEIITQTYPAVNYNFPAVHTQYYESAPMFDDFEGIINKRVLGGFVHNDIDGAQTKNRNIVYPFPYHLYVLKACIEDAGYVLKGDVLNDPDLIDAVIVPPGKITAFEDIPDKVEWNVGIGDKTFDSGFPVYLQTWHSEQEINFRGSFHLFGTINDEVLWLKLTLNGSVIFEFSEGMPLTINEWFELDTEANSLVVDIVSQFITNPASNAAMMVLETLYLTNENGEMLPFFANFSNVQLAAKLPDMTVGDFIKFHKRLKNYDFDLRKNNEIWMNLIQNEVEDSIPVDVSEFDNRNVIRKFEQSKSFVLKYEGEYEDHHFTQVYADKEGYKVDDFQKKENTQEISINGLPLPIEAIDGITTAKQITDDSSKLLLVKYSGLTNGENWTKPFEELDCFRLYVNHWSQWLNFMIHAVKFNWTIKGDANQLIRLGRKSKLFAYNNLHFVYSLNRRRKKEIEEVEIEAYTTKV